MRGEVHVEGYVQHFQVHNLCYSMHLRYSEYVGRLSEQ